MALVDRAGRILSANLRYCDLVGYTEAELTGRDFLALIHPDDLADSVRVLGRLLAGEIDRFQAERRYVHTSGRHAWVLLHVAATRDQAGIIRHFIAQAVDITERKQAEARLRESEENLRQMADAMPQVVWVAEADGTVGYYNDRVVGFGGVVRAESGAWEWLPALHPDDRQATLVAWERAMRDRAPYASEHRIMMADGGYRWHLSRAVPILDAHGAVRTWYGTATDIHELKQADLDRRRQGERLRLGVEVAGFALTEVDYASGVAYLSPEAARLYGLGDAAMTVSRDRLHATFHPAEWDELARLIADSLDPAGVGWFATEHRVVQPDGVVRWLSVRKQVFFDRSGPTARPVRSILAALDITTRKEEARELERRRREFETLAEHAPDIVARLDRDLRYRYVNPAVETMTGRPAGEFLGKTTAELGMPCLL